MLFLVFKKEISMMEVRVKSGSCCEYFDNMNDAMSYCVRNNIIVVDVISMDIIELEDGYITVFRGYNK